MSDPVSIEVFNPGDGWEEEDMWLPTALQRFVNGDLTAQAMSDTLFRGLSEKALLDMQNYDKQLTNYKTPNEVDEAAIRGPMLDSEIRYIWYLIFTGATSLPPAHYIQDKLIKLLQTLSENETNIEGVSESGKMYEMPIWDFTDLESYKDAFSMRHFGGAQDCPDPNTTVFVSWNAFWARMFSAGLSCLISRTALHSSTFFTGEQPLSNNVDTMRYGLFAMAAAQWILYAGEEIFEICEKGESPAVWLGGMKKSHWQFYKRRFSTIASQGTMYKDELRQCCEVVVERMEAIEKRGITTDIVGIYDGYDPESGMAEHDSPGHFSD